MTQSAPEANGARKDDDGKPMVFSLVLAYFPRALREVAKVSKYGLDKYQARPEDKGFLKIEDARRRYTDGLVRHLIGEEIEGPINETDGGLYHDAQVAWNALARLEKRLVDEEKAEEALAQMGGFIEAASRIPASEPGTRDFDVVV